MSATARRAWPSLIGFLLVLSITGCGSGGRSFPEPSGAEQALIVDVDMDSSDVFALAYALRLPGYRVEAVTVSGTGVGTCPKGASNAAAITAVMGRPDIPVGCGSSQAVGYGHAFPDEWRAPSDALYGMTLPPAVASAPAAQLITSVLETSESPVVILVAGPLTNIAEVLIDRPELRSKVRRLVAMAGAFDVSGNVGPQASVGSPEWNVWADPGAAAAVLDSGVPVVLVPLDATNRVPITGSAYTDLEADHRAAGASLTYELLGRNPFLLGGGQYWWDPLAAALLEAPEVAQDEERRVRIGLEGVELGRTMVDQDGAVVRVAVAADPARFAEVFLAGLRRGPARGDGWETVGRTTVRYDGVSCATSGEVPMAPGPYAISVANDTQAMLLVAAVSLHEGATWEQLEAFVASIEEQTANPDFADVTFIQPQEGLAQLMNLPPGLGGFVCIETAADGTVQRVVLAQPYTLAP